MAIDERLLKPYSPSDTEDRIYKLWEESGFFNPDNLPQRLAQGKLVERSEPFTIIMPPTNANGNLHAGHGLVMTVEDIMTRYARMRGKRALWLPGNDHAGFETWVVYEKKLQKEGRSRFDMDPKDLYKEIWDFTQSNRDNINSQVKKMGASCDWSREKFTLDDDVIKIVYKTFKQLADDDLVYRGRRLVSWCPKHQTSFSDLEIADEERIDPFYYFKYGPFVIGTVRPETKFGDKYVVMHPDDKRYEQYKHGDTFDLEWINGPITATVIKDEAADPEIGSGVMTITPAHSGVDFEIAQRHNLPIDKVIDDRGKLLPIAGEFEGVKIAEAREKIVEKMEAKGLVDHVDVEYKHTVRKCYKCSTLIEPQVMPQWFVKMKPLAEPVIKAIENGEVEFIPQHYKKITLHWLNNIIDWNISRQIIWGIAIPAKLCKNCDKGFVDIDDKLLSCESCGGELVPETDTFDTWFSSGQWPFAALGYPESEDSKMFYPTDVMETAGEIIFFWVTRMLMLGKYVTGELPFKKVYLHGLVLDGKGQKMSKSKGNVIDPLTYTEKFGTDAFRMGLVVGNTPGTSLALAEDKIKAYKHFVNKLWNVSRFIIENSEGVDTADKPKLTDDDKEKLAELSTLIDEVTEELDGYKFYLSAEKIYHYVWHTVADKYIEEAKPILSGNDESAKRSAQWTLRHILETSLKLLHPFAPFVTEEIWGIIGHKQLLIVESWPHS